jgi:hypothetical protein
MTVRASAASLAYDVMDTFWSSASTSDLARRQGRDAWPGGASAAVDSQRRIWRLPRQMTRTTVRFL